MGILSSNNEPTQYLFANEGGGLIFKIMSCFAYIVHPRTDVSLVDSNVESVADVLTLWGRSQGPGLGTRQLGLPGRKVHTVNLTGKGRRYGERKSCYYIAPPPAEKMLYSTSKKMLGGGEGGI